MYASIACIIGSCAGVVATIFGSAFALALACGDLDLGPLTLAGPCGFGNAACGGASCMNSANTGLLLDLTRLACIREAGGGGGGDCMLYLKGSRGCVGTASAGAGGGGGGGGAPPFVARSAILEIKCWFAVGASGSN